MALYLTLDSDRVADARGCASQIARDVYRELVGLSTIGIERAVLRLLGVDGADGDGVPFVNRFVDSLIERGVLQDGAAYALACTAHELDCSVDEAVITVINGDGVRQCADPSAAHNWLGQEAEKTNSRIQAVRDCRREMLRSYPCGAEPWRYVIVATGNIFEDIPQAQLAAEQGAQIIAVIRSTAQSLLEHIPEGPTTEGYGGTFATQANFRLMRAALDETSRKLGRYVRLTNYASGLCMAEMAALGARERLDMMLSDSMYGILFRDINMQRTLLDQRAARRIQGECGIIINTGEDNYLTTTDAKLAAHTVLASQFINEAFAHEANLPDELIGLGHAFEMNPAEENGLLLEIADALLSRHCFPDAPLKYMPPTRFMDGDIFHGNVLDALFNLTSVATRQKIHLVGVLTEALHSPHVQDRAIALKNVDYVHRYARDFFDEFSIRSDGIINRRANDVLSRALSLLGDVREIGLFAAIEAAKFGGIARGRQAGRGRDGVFKITDRYCDPLQLLPRTEVRC